MSSSRAETLAALREHLNRVAPMRAPAATRARLPLGVPELERFLHGWPRPGLAELAGAVGSGRLDLVLPALQELTHSGNTVGVVDPVGWLNPPGLRGVVLDRVLLVRPGATRAGWATEQLLRSGALPLVLLVDPGPLRRSGRRLQHAAEAGDACLCVLSERHDPSLPAALRLEVRGQGRVRIAKGAPRHQGREVVVRGGPALAPVSRGQTAHGTTP